MDGAGKGIEVPGSRFLREVKRQDNLQLFYKTVSQKYR